MGRELNGVTPEAYEVLRQYSWPGNVRELQNVIRRAAALSNHKLIEVADLPDEVVSAAGKPRRSGEDGFFALRERYMAEFERRYFSELLARHQGNVKSAAAEARLPRGTFYRLLKNHGLESADFRGRGPLAQQ
jgi:DNA-binding NtrC family response regulator